MPVSKRRKPKKPVTRSIRGTYAQMIEATASHLLDGFDRSHILVGPVVREPIEPLGTWYFVVISGGSGGHDGLCRAEKLMTQEKDDGTDTGRMRDAIMSRLISEAVGGERPFVMHDFADELELAAMAATLWPSERNKQIEQNIRRERAH